VAHVLQLSLPFEAPKREPKAPLRRRVFRVRLEPNADGTYFFKARSFTHRKGAHRLRVNPVTGFVSCTCKDFRYRRQNLEPTYFGGEVCKHLTRALKTVRKLQREMAEDGRMAA
jgi:hypothetical protein